MSSVLVSSRSFTAGAQIAAAAAHSLGHDFASFDDLVASAASRYAVPADKLRDALVRAPSLLGMADRTRRHLARMLIAECSARVERDQVVLHVPFASSMVPGISHVLRARITSRTPSRVQAAADELRLSPEKAAKRVAADDRDRDVICMILFGKADDDSSYDLVVNLDGGPPEQAAQQLVNTAAERRYLASSYSAKSAAELAAANAIEASLAAREVDAVVTVHDGQATVRAHAPAGKRAELVGAVETLAARLPAIKKAEVVWVDDLFDSYAASMR